MNEEARIGLAAQIDAIVTGTLERLTFPNGPLDAGTGEKGRATSDRIGATREAQNIHPSESLKAASVLFDVGLPSLIECLDRADAPSAADTARVFHDSIMKAIIPASLGYVNALLARLTDGVAVAVFVDPATDENALVGPDGNAVDANALFSPFTPVPDPLTDREREVLRLIAQAYSNHEIGVELRISDATVKRHATNIYAKLGAVSRIDAVRKAAHRGIRAT